MGNELGFDGKVAIITGAGNGLGRAHALLLASRGARVVVNDLGGGATGDGKSAAAADQVVDEIKAAGGEAVPNYDSVEDGDKIVKTAMDAYGRVDIVVNNAGILRDKSFVKMTEDDWDLIYRVHVRGSFKVTHTVWPIMREQGYGRIVMTASAAGIYGNFGQANYSMAKLGLAGFANTLALEGRRKNILVNTVAPLAGSRLTETILPKEMCDALAPEFVSPLVAWLCHEECDESGGLFEVGGGFFAKLRWERAAGKMYRVGRAVSIENVRDSWDDIAGFEKSEHPTNVATSMQPIMANLEAGPSKGGNEFIDVDEALGYEFPEESSAYDERDLALYALGVGAGTDPLDDKDLQLVYELHGEGFKALPTFAVTPAINTVLRMAKAGKTAPGLNYGLDRILHGEQYTELKRPLPAKADLTHKIRIKDIWDKKKGAIVVSEIISYDEDGDELMRNEVSMFVRGAGGWGGERGPSAATANQAPDRAPDATVTENISVDQALLYRLSGDWNPLHVDPSFAKAFGYDKPILHGLCTFGYAARHVIREFSGGDPRYFKSIKVRFADNVFPGETLTTEMWKESDTSIIFRCKVKERDAVVISNARIELYPEIPKKKVKAKKVAAPAGAAVSSEPNSADVFTAIGQYLVANPDLVGTVKSVFKFKLTSPDSVWLIDVKDKPGTSQSDGKADCNLELSDQDFMDMCTGKADAMKLFNTGKLKITGDIMASQKLDFLRKLPPETVVAAARARAGAGGAGGGGADVPAEPNSAMAFIGIQVYVERNPELVGKVGKVFLFKLKDPESQWTIDLKNGTGAVGEGAVGKPDCTLELSDQDFMDMGSGKADPMKLFTSGALKISGDIMASQKLDFLQKVDPDEIKDEVLARIGAGGGGGGAAVPAEPNSAMAFVGIQVYVERNPELVDKIGKVFLFKLTDPESQWTIDLKNDKGAVATGSPVKPDCTLELSDKDFMDMGSGKADPMKLFTSGALKISGDIMASQKLDFLQKVDPDEIKDEVLARLAAGAGGGATVAGADAAKDAAPDVFAKLGEALVANPGLADEFKAVVQFNVTDPDKIWVVDLSSSPGAVREGAHDGPTTTVSISDADLGALAKGEEGLQSLFMHGKLRVVDGDFTVVPRLGFMSKLA